MYWAVMPVADGTDSQPPCPRTLQQPVYG